MNFIYVVMGWNDFYPSPDNSLGLFSKRVDAEEFLDSYKKDLNRQDGWGFQHYVIVSKQVK